MKIFILLDFRPFQSISGSKNTSTENIKNLILGCIQFRKKLKFELS